MADNRLKWHSGGSDFIQLADEMNEGMSKLTNSKLDNVRVCPCIKTGD